MRLAATLFVGCVVLWAGQAQADSDNSNKDHTKHEDNGGGNQNGNGNGNGNSNGNGSSSAGNSGAVDPEPSTTDQNGALDAVKRGESLPLKEIVALAEAKWGGRAIDAELVKVRNRLLYRLTMLSDDGVSQRVYYDARSGRSAKSP